MDKLISIVVPVYNTEKYLKKCVNTIVNQTYKNLEIILVDDGSTDNSGKMCDELANTDNRIKVIHKKNGGLSSARNEAMKVVSGDLIAFVDSDDCLVLDFYEYLYNLLNKYNADIAEAEFLRIPDDRIDEVQKIVDEKNKSVDIKETVCNNIEALRELYGIKEDPYVKKVVVWNKLYKREVLDNIVFPEGKLHEDEFTTHKILYNTKTIASSNRYIYGYMQTKNSIMRAEISERRVNDNLGASISALEFFENKNFPDIEAKIVLRYLENCIELSGKISKENSDNKNDKLSLIEKKFISFYDNLDGIEEYINTDLENQIYKLLCDAYKSTLEKHNLFEYWDKLSSIIK